MNMTTNFSYDELVYSETAVSRGIGNEPNTAQIMNLLRLCTQLLEPIRTLIGGPIHINSGFRSLEVNKLVGGQPASAHKEGLAADIIFPKNTLAITDIWVLIKDSLLPYDQLIVETSSKTGSIWIHVAASRAGIVPRRQAFTLTKRETRFANG